MKEIVTIVTGLTLTNSVIVLITRGHYSGVQSLSNLPTASILYTAVFILTVVRFYHGNIRHVDSVYGLSESTKITPSNHGHGRFGLGIDFVVLFTQSIIIAVDSFYASRRSEFLLLILTLLVFDILWTLLTQQQSTDASVFVHQRRWMLNNLVAVLVLTVCYTQYRDHHTALVLDVGVGVVLANTIADFAINWSFYFPHLVTNDV